MDEEGVKKEECREWKQGNKLFVGYLNASFTVIHFNCMKTLGNFLNVHL